MIIVSLATYPRRLSKLHQVIPTILGQTLQFDKLFINIPDNLTELDYRLYDEFKKYDQRIEIHQRDYRWRSANKYLWTYKEHPNDVIITCDDDLLYRSSYFQDLYDQHIKNPTCIICHEVNPMVVQQNYIRFINDVDIKLRQREFGKYLTGCCLFPPCCMEGTDAYNYEQFMQITNACHDELWFWIMTTLKGIQCIGLNQTWSFDLDDCALPPEETSLRHVIGKPETIKMYEQLINTHYGKQLVHVMTTIPTMFDVTIENFLSYFGNMQWIHQLYGQIPIRFSAVDLPKSQLTFLLKRLNCYQWKKVEVQVNKQVQLDQHV